MQGKEKQTREESLFVRTANDDTWRAIRQFTILLIDPVPIPQRTARVLGLSSRGSWRLIPRSKLIAYARAISPIPIEMVERSSATRRPTVSRPISRGGSSVVDNEMSKGVRSFVRSFVRSSTKMERSLGSD